MARYIGNWLLIVLLGAAGCRGTDDVSHSFPKNLFQNSLRRDALPHEAESVVRINSGCTAFFIENAKGQVILGSAAHCMKYKMEEWCQQGTFKDNHGRTGACDEILVTAKDTDIVIFRAKDYDPAWVSRPLRLAGYDPEPQDRLWMIGYPGDINRKGRLTVTENCWVKANHQPSPYPPSMPHQGDTVFTHNCSTYGGNSGGPVVREGTRDVVGEPYTYLPDYMILMPADGRDYIASGASMAQFVANHRDRLAELGLSLSGQMQKDMQDLPVMPEASEGVVRFVAVCQRAQATQQTQQGAPDTALLLLQLTGTSDCREAGTKLSTTSEIALQSLNIADLSIFGTGLFDENLKMLYLDGNPIRDIAPLKSLQALRVLHLDLTGFQNVEHLATMPALHEVSLSGNGIEDISGFGRDEGSIKLKTVYLDNNRISDASAMAIMGEGLTATFNGNAGDNRRLIQSLAIAGLKFKELGLANLSLENLDGLPWESFRRLKTLVLDDNKIQDLTPLSVLGSSISELSLANNQVGDVTGLGNYILLSRLDLSQNQIHEVTPLASLSLLSYLNVRFNQIEDFSSLSGLGFLQRLDVRDNPGTVNGQCPHPRAQCLWE